MFKRFKVMKYISNSYIVNSFLIILSTRKFHSIHNAPCLEQNQPPSDDFRYKMSYFTWKSLTSLVWIVWVAWSRQNSLLVQRVCTHSSFTLRKKYFSNLFGHNNLTISFRSNSVSCRYNDLKMNWAGLIHEKQRTSFPPQTCTSFKSSRFAGNLKY